MAGVDATGFVKKARSAIVDAINSAWRASFGDAIYAEESIFEQLREPFATELDEAWQAQADIATAHNPDQAEGVWLDDALTLSGLSRNNATRSTVPVNLVGTPGETIEADPSMEFSTDAGDKFVLDDDVVLDGSGDGSGTATAAETGPVQALSGTLTNIDTPHPELTSVTNPEDATLGRNAETDTAARIRRAGSVAVIGSGYDSMLARLLDLDDVTHASIVENDDATTDADGRPRNSFEVIVAGGDDDEIAQVVWDCKGLGIKPVSTVGAPSSGDATDRDGNTRTIAFSRPEDVNIWVEVDLALAAGVTYPSDYEAQVAAAVLDWGNEFGVGEEVLAQSIYSAIHSIAKFDNDTAVRIGTSSGPGTFDDIAITSTQRAAFDSARITVTTP